MVIIMEKVNSCIICGSKEMEKRRCLIAPFIRDRINTPEKYCDLLICKKCYMAFFDYRYTEDEVAKLYYGYRDENYIAMREKCETGYAEAHKKIVASDEVRVRKDNLEKFLRSSLRQDAKIRTVLDYGGDKGQFIPERFKNSRRYVYDISGITTIQGVEIIEDPAKKAPFDFTMCCHVLEHVSYPLEIIDELKALTKRSGLIYLELPVLESIKEFSNIICRKEIFSQPYLFHEHINFFTLPAIKKMAAVSEVTLVNYCLKRLDFGYSKAIVLSVLIRNQKSEKKQMMTPKTDLIKNFCTLFYMKLANRYLK